MVEQALFLANDHNSLKLIRLQQQRQQVAQSELLDHAGLAASLEDVFAAGGCDGFNSRAGQQRPNNRAWPLTSSP